MQSILRVLALACSLLLPGRVAAQFLAQDTAAVRVILSENQLDLPISQVVEISGDRVVSLILENRQLVRVPPHIGALTALRTLSLAGNLLDSLPAETWNLANLSQLDLGGNQLCALSPDLADWANRADPDWRAAQNCGLGVRRAVPRTRSGRLSLERVAGGLVLRLDRPVDLAGRARPFPIRAP